MDKEEEKHLKGRYLSDDHFESIYKTVMFIFLSFVIFWIYTFYKKGYKTSFKPHPPDSKLGGLLASERTFLAYLRTCVSFVGLGLALYKMFDNKIMGILSIFSLLISLSILIYGNITYINGLYSINTKSGFINNNIPMFIGTLVITCCILLILYATNEDRIANLIDEYSGRKDQKFLNDEENDNALLAIQLDQVTST